MRVHPSILALALCGCATAAAGPRAADVPALEARLRADSTSSDVRVRLAAAYREAGHADRAIALLEPVLRAHPNDAAAALYLGLSYEDGNRLADARRVYAVALRNTRSPALRDRIQSRVVLLSRRELREASRQALARERELSTTPPPPRTVGVFPFFFAAQDTTLRPLSRAMAELLTTDLSQTDRLRVVERAQLQALLDEMALAQRGTVDPATAARTGHLVGAAHIVQGRIDGSPATLSMQALVVATASPRDTAGAAIRGQGGVNRLFDMEKNIALGVYTRLGIQLTDAERARVNRRATQNVQALIAFGYGLEALDAGRYAEASRQFARAAQLDPGFVKATELRSESDQLTATANFGTGQMARLAASELNLTLTPFQRQQLRLEALDAIIPIAQMRDPTVEVLGTEGIRSRHRHRHRHQAARRRSVRRWQTHAALLACAGCTVAGRAAAQATGQAGGGFAFELYHFSDAAALGMKSLTLLTLPFAGRADLTPRLSLSVNGAFARGELKPATGSVETVSGLTDTEVRASYVAGRDFVTLSVVGLLPTGHSKLTVSESDVAGAVAADVLPFRISNWGSGGGLGASVSVARPLGSVNAGISAGYVVAREFEPLEGSASQYRPGNQLHLTGALDHNAGASRLALRVSWLSFNADQSDGANLYQAGDRLQATGSVAFAAGARASALVYAGWLHRSEGRFQTVSLITAAEQLLLAGGGLRMPLGPGVLQPSIDLRVLGGSAAAGRGYTASAGASAEFPAGGATVAPTVRARFGTLKPRRGVSSGFSGAEIGLSIRFGPR